MVEVTPDQRVSKDSDLHFFVTVEEAATQTFVAWAAPCAIAPNGRPIFGQINFNSKFISVNVSNYNFQKYIETTVTPSKFRFTRQSMCLASLMFYLIIGQKNQKL